MSAPNILPFGLRDSAVDRQVIVDTLHQMLDGHTQLDGFPDNLKLALDGRIWEGDRVFPGGTRQGPMTLHAFVHEHYPAGLGASYGTVERLISDRPDVLAVWTEVTKRSPGGNNNPTGANQHKRSEDTLYNIQGEQPKAPTGTSVEAGLRKLQKAATEGNDEAAAQLAEVVAGHKKVHTACVDAGLRKSTKIDADVKARCSRSVAEWIVERAGQDDVSGIVADLFACGAKSVAIEIKNLVGEASTMDSAGWGR